MASQNYDVLAAHADWSTAPQKRWISLAHGNAGRFRLAPPVLAPAPANLAGALLTASRGAPVALGVDAPLGLPRAYGAACGERDFLDFLRGTGRDAAFFSVAEALDQVSLARPFFPARNLAGLTRQAHARALGLGSAAGLHRACDLATRERPAGAPLFWTLGANQTGKAAISLWRDALIGPRAHPGLRLWPFEGRIAALLAPGQVAMAETYPAQCLRLLGLVLRGSKRRQQDRAALAGAIAAVMRGLSVRAAAGFQAACEDGFGADAAGEDRFDSVLGVLGVIAVLRGAVADFLPDDPAITRWEGWVLGQRELPLSYPPRA